jgi:putative acetyltransferase
MSSAPNSQTVIRLATRSDEPGIVKLIQHVYEEFQFPWDAEGYNADLYDLDTHYFSKGDLFWVAERPTESGASEIIASGALEFFPTLGGEPDTLLQVDDLLRIAGTDCALHRLYLYPHVRGQGLGKRLTLLALETAANKGCQRMEIWSDKRLTTAHKLYQNLGATIVGERLCNDPEQAPEWGLVLPLSHFLTN